MTKAAPQAVVVSGNPDLKEAYGDRVLVPEDGMLLLNRFQVVTIPGHTADSAALLDTQINTLITGDYTCARCTAAMERRNNFMEAMEALCG